MSRRTLALLGLGALAAAAAIVVGVLLATGASGSSAAWQNAETAPFAQAGNADAAVAGDGTVIVAWTERRRGHTSVLAAERAPDGEWSSPQVVEAPQSFQVMGPNVAAGADGGAVVTYNLWARQKGVLMASYRRPGGEWEAPQALTASARGAYSGQAAVADNGTVTVAWSRSLVPDGRLAAATRPPGAAWSDGIDVARRAQGGGDPRLAVAPAGGAYIATPSFRPPNRTSVDVHRREDDGRWVRIATPATGRWAVDVIAATDDAGRLVLAWTSMGRDGETTLWTSRLDGATWTASRRLDRAPGPEYFGALTAGRAGDGVAVAWVRWERVWVRSSVRVAVGDAAPVTVDAFDVPDIRGGNADTQPGPPPGSVLVAGGDRPTLVWNRLVTREPTFETRLYAATASGDGAWSDAEPVASEPSSGGWPLAAGPGRDGGLVAAWARYVRPGGPGLQVLVAERPG